MSQAANAELRTAQEIIRATSVNQSPNGICYATAGELTLPAGELEKMIAAVPRSIAAALDRKAYYFVPLTVSDGDKTLIAERYDSALSDQAICHRNIDSGDAQCVFISTRILDDKFAVGFEFYTNVAHPFVDTAGISPEFAELVWKQAADRVRGETSLDAFEFRKQAFGERGRVDEKAKTEYASAAFSDAIAIYILSLYADVEYIDLREPGYPLLAPSALAERLKKVAQIFPPNPGFEFHVYYRRSV